MANNIKQLREAAGMTQAELAAKMQLTTPSITKWELGRANPTYDNLIQLAEIFGVSLDEVAGRKTSAQKGGVVDGEKAPYVV